MTKGQRITIKESTLQRLSKYQTGFQTEDQVINQLLDQLETKILPSQDLPTKPKTKISSTKKTKRKKGKKATYDFDEDVQRS